MRENKEKMKIRARLSVRFHKIFETSHLIYTIFFVLVILIISFMSFSENVGDLILFFATMTSLMFLILTIVGIFSKTEGYLFSKERNNYARKLFAIMLGLGISFVILSIYFLFGSSSQITIQFLGWDILLPSLFVIIYFGWNLIQIFFIRLSFENIANKTNNIIIKQQESNLNRNKKISTMFTIIAVFITVLIQISTHFGALSLFEPASPTDSSVPLYWFQGWNIFMYGLIFLLSYRLYQLQIQSQKNETPNIFSSIFHILIWIIIWYRSFSFIYSFMSIENSTGVDVLRIFSDILLMIMTSVLVLRGLGAKVYRFKIFNPNNLPFFLFAFTILYIEGQVIMIIGGGSISGLYSSRGEINLVNNFLILLITVIFYWWYSKFSLEKNNLIFKKSFNQKEVVGIVYDFKNYLENSGALELEKIDNREINQFLKNKKIKEENLPPPQKIANNIILDEDNDNYEEPTL
ncbi:MAG: hypothetical protein ACTSV5_10720 [Promethearchaeota archaeon]